jgi:SPW repeat-containing protein
MRKGEGLQIGRVLLLLFGIWLVTSPWIFGYARHTHAVQDTIVGVLVVAAAVTSMLLGPATAAPLWTALVLGIWTFVTPMMFGQAGPSFSANNDLVVGMLIALAAGIAIVSRVRMRLWASDADSHAASGQTSLW